ncbi:MAG: hypothetical protein C0501_28195 [Isosphaera sp.]|nr:hypothetical protein [Isosphaera sp.]
MRAPPYHDAAMSYLMAHPGVSYERAVELVSGRPLAATPAPSAPAARPAPAPGPDPHQPPAGHEAAVAYMMSHPGTSYERACEATSAVAATPAGRPLPPPPWFHGRAMAYMTANPGTAYDAACAAVKKAAAKKAPAERPVYYDRPGDLVFVPFRAGR